MRNWNSILHDRLLYPRTKYYFICIISFVSVLGISCTDDHSTTFDPEMVVRIIQEGQDIDTGCVQVDLPVTILVTPLPINADSILGTLSVSRRLETFDLITIKLERDTFFLTEQNNYTDQVLVSIIPNSELDESISESYTINLDLLDSSPPLSTHPGNFNIAFRGNHHDKMEFRSLIAGQTFEYVLLKGSDYYSSDTFFYTGDTLQLEVIKVAGDTLVISERITDFSEMKADSDSFYDYWGDKNAVHTNYWILRNDSLIFEPSGGRFESHLISHDHVTDIPYNINLSLKKFEEEEVEITGWRTSYPYIEANIELFTTDYSLFCNQYDHLNINVYNSRLAADAFGLTTVYSKELGIVKTSRYLWNTKSGIGWDKL